MDLHEIQTQVRAGKDKRNDFGKYNYRTAEGILAAAKAVLPEGASIVCSDELQEVAGRIFVTATATIRMSDGAEYSAKGHAMHALQKKGMDEAQITGACSSYARKFALGGLLALDDGSVDPDARDNREEETPKPDHNAMAQRLIAAAQKAKTVADLDRIWADEKETRSVLSEAGMLGPVADAFGAKKRALMEAPKPATDFDTSAYSGATQ